MSTFYNWIKWCLLTVFHCLLYFFLGTQRARVRSPVETSLLREVFSGFSSPVRQMSGSFRPPRSPNIIWPPLSSIIIHYGRQRPEMLTRPTTSNIHTIHTSSLAFAVQPGYIPVHISETLARKRSVFEHKFISKIWWHRTHLPTKFKTWFTTSFIIPA